MDRRLTEREGKSLPAGTPLKTWPRPIGAFTEWRYGILEIRKGQPWFQSVAGAAWPIQYWDDFAVASKEEFVAKKLEQDNRKMESSTSFFRTYSDIISEAQKEN